MRREACKILPGSIRIDSDRFGSIRIDRQGRGPGSWYLGDLERFRDAGEKQRCIDVGDIQMSRRYSNISISLDTDIDIVEGTETQIFTYTVGI